MACIHASLQKNCVYAKYYIRRYIAFIMFNVHNVNNFYRVIVLNLD